MFVRTIVLVLVLFGSLSGAYAQTCSPPTITLAAGQSPSCADSLVRLDAGAGWATYQWSTGATTRKVDLWQTPGTTQSYTVTVSDGAGCTVTSAPYELTVIPRMAQPVLAAPASTCAGRIETATVSASDEDQWTSVAWGIEHGQFVDENGYEQPYPSSKTVHFKADGSGPVALFALPFAPPPPGNWGGCPAPQATATVAVPPTVIEIVAPADTCAGIPTQASVLPPAEGSWTGVQWTIQGGSFRDPYGNPTAWGYGETVEFTADGQQPVTLHAMGMSSTGCTSVEDTAVVTIHALPAPQLSVPAEVCPYTPAEASILPPAEGTWVTVSWGISGGTFVDANGNPVENENGETARFISNGGPVTLHAWAEHSSGCNGSEGVAEVPIRTIPVPQLSVPPQVCPYTPAEASILPPAEGTWVTVSWGISGGSFVDANGNPVSNETGETARFISNGGPVTLYAWAQDSFGCSPAEGTAQVPIRTIPAPQLSVPPEVCPYTPAEASVLPPAEGAWATVSWGISGGSFVDANGNPVSYENGETARFISNGGPVTLYAWAQDSFGCSATQGTAQVPIRTIPAPELSVPPEVCPYTPAEASILPPEEGTWQTVSWSITGGSFVDVNGNPMSWANGETVRFMASSANPVTLHAWAQDSFGCNASEGTAEVPIRTIDAPQISAPPQVCAYVPATASLLPPEEGTWQTVSWSITGGTFIDANGNPMSWANGEEVRFIANQSSNPVTLFAWAQDSFGCHAADGNITIPTVAGGGGPLPSIVLSSPDICGPEVLTASVDSVFASYAWTVVNGTITSGDGTNAIAFVANGNGAVTVSVTTNAATCAATDSETLPLRAAPLSFSAPSSACTGSLQKAWAPYWYSGFSWTATNATIEGPSDGDTLWFRSTGAGPVILSVSGVDYQGCFTRNSVTLPLGGYPVPELIYPQGTSLCPGRSSGVQASDFYPSYEWAVTNATILSGQGTPVLNFQHTPGAGDVGITLNVGEGACTATASTTMTVLPTVELVAELATPAVCPNGTGTFYVDNYSIYPGVYTYVTNGQITGISAGRVPGGRTYTFRNNGLGDTTIRVMGDSQCQVTKEWTVPMLAAPAATVTAGGPTTFCAGGSVTLTANAGASYLWSNGATTQSISATTAGSYTVTVTNANGCSATSAATNVVVNAAPATPVITPSGPTTFCVGGSVTLTAPASASYLWSNGATTQSIVVSATGTYGVTVTNASGCSATSAPVGVTVNTAPPPVITASNRFPCPGDPVTLTASAAASYLWSTGETTQTITVAPTAFTSYSVQTTTAQGCPSSASLTIFAGKPAKPTVTVQGSAPYCDAETVTLTAMEYFPAHTYLWSTGQTTRTIQAPAGGTYTVVATNTHGCASDPSDPVVLPTETPTATVTGTTEMCPGGSAALQVALTGTAPWRIDWSDGLIQTGITTSPHTRYVVPSSTTTYSITSVSDAHCSGAGEGAAVVTVNSLPSVSITASGPTTFCEGGSVTLTASAGASYLWSTGATTQSIAVSASGSYSVTMTNENGCGAPSSATNVVVNPNPATPVITAGGPTTFCEGGSVTLTAPASASYLWSNGATTQSIAVSASGSYSVTVTNASGCSATSAATSVTVHAQPATPVVTAGGPTTFCEGGSVTLTAPSSASYLWSNGATTQSIVVSASGSYSVTVANASGCSATSAATSVIVNTLPAATIAADGPTTFCEGGSVTLSAPAGLSYLWSTGATTQSVVVSASGSYSVTVTNASGCSATSAATSVTVHAQPATPVVTAGGPTTFCEGGSVTLTAPASASYLWSTGATTQSIVVTASGSYSVTVANASGCSATSAATSVTVNTLPAATIAADGPTTFCAGGSVTLSAPAGLSYLWSTGATTQSIVVSASGSYTVTTTNASGCSATSAATSVSVNTLPAAAIAADGPTTFCEGGSVTLTASAGASYLWSNGATTQSIAVSASGSYSVTVTNASSCSATSTATTVTVNAAPVQPVVTPSGPTTFCAGGSVTLTAPASSSYLWSTGATTQSIAVSASGSYSVTVTNASGCSATSAATSVTVNANPAQPAITPSGPTTFCQGGSVTLTAPASASYLWSTGATTQSIAVSASGSFSVTVTNASGCSATSAPTAVTVNANPAQPAITPSGPTTFCQGGSVTLTAPASASYLWSTGATTQSIAVNASGSYSVTVGNASGCTATSTPTTVTVNPLPAVPVITPSGSTSLCPGASVTLTAPASTSYLWSTGATTQSIVVSTAGSYSVTVTNANGCSRTSAPVSVTANPPTVITTHPASQTIPRNVTAVLSVAASGTPNLQYQWYNGTSPTTTSPIAGATSSTLTIGPFTKKGTSRFWVRVTSTGCPSSVADSNTAVITIN